MRDGGRRERGSVPKGPEELSDEKSCDLRGSPIADLEGGNFSEGKKNSALALAHLAAINAAAPTVAVTRKSYENAEEGIFFTIFV